MKKQFLDEPPNPHVITRHQSLYDMKAALNHYVLLRAAFRRRVSSDGQSGEELTSILEEGLSHQGIPVLKAEWTGYCYCLECKSGESTIDLMVGEGEVGESEAEETNDWWDIQCPGWHPHFGAKRVFETDCRQLLLAVDHVLQGCGSVSGIRWYPSFAPQEYLALMPCSAGPVPSAEFYTKLHPLIRLSWRLDRVTSAMTHPLGMLGSLVLVCILSVLTPQSAMAVACVLVFALMALGTVAPIVLDWLISRQAKQHPVSIEQDASSVLAWAGG